MKYKGTLIFIRVNPLDSIYKIENSANAKLMLSEVIATVREGSISIAYNSFGYGYTTSFKHTVNNIFEGEIISERELLGTATLYLYQFVDKLLCKIIHFESGQTFDCFMELFPYTPR